MAPGPHRRGSRNRRGLALREVTTAVAFGGVALALLSVAVPRFRSGALLEECIDNQREMSAGSAAYALANQDEFVGLNWKRNNTTSAWADLDALAAQTHVGAHAAQVIDLLRRHGRLDVPAFTFFPDDLQHASPLIDFLGKDLTDPFNVCPADEYRLAWRADPAGFDAGVYLPFQPAGGNAQPLNKYWPYTSSYRFTASAFDPLQSDPGANIGSRLSQHGFVENGFTIPSFNPLGPSLTSLVAYPSAKVFFFDHADRHFAVQATQFAVPGAVVTAAFFDNSVRVVEGDRANVPWQPRTPNAPEPTQYTYVPPVWEPLGGVPPPPPSGFLVLTDPFRYTRDGLRGIDFPPLSRSRRGVTTRSQ